MKTSHSTFLFIGTVLLHLFSSPACGFFVDEKKANEYFKKGREFDRNNDHSKAVEWYSKAIGENPGMVKAYEKRGYSYREMRQRDKAIEDFSRAIDIDPERKQSILARAYTYSDLMEYEKVIEDYDRYLKIDPKFSTAWNNRCFALIRIGKFSEAIESCSEAVKLDPEPVFPLSNRGNAFILLGQFNKAVQDYERVIELSGTKRFFSSTYLFSRGKAYIGLGHIERGMQDFKAATKDKPNEMISYTRGIVNFYQGNYEQGLEDFEISLEKNRKRQFTHNILPPIWTYLSLKALKKITPEQLTELESLSSNKTWPAPLFSLFEGKISPTQLLDQARDKKEWDTRRKQGEAYFYIGQNFLMKGNPSEAKKWFNKLLKAELTELNEIYAAHLALASLK